MAAAATSSSFRFRSAPAAASSPWRFRSASAAAVSSAWRFCSAWRFSSAWRFCSASAWRFCSASAAASWLFLSTSWAERNSLRIFSISRISQFSISISAFSNKFFKIKSSSISTPLLNSTKFPSWETPWRLEISLTTLSQAWKEHWFLGDETFELIFERRAE